MDDYGGGGSGADLIIAVALFALVMWILVKSPLISALVELALLILWGLGTLGAVLFVAIGIHVPKGHYVAAVVTILVGAAIYVPFFLFGLPMMKDVASKLAKSPAIWK